MLQLFAVSFQPKYTRFGGVFLGLMSSFADKERFPTAFQHRFISYLWIGDLYSYLTLVDAHIDRISIKVIFRWCEGLVSIRTESCRRSRVAFGRSRSCKVNISGKGVFYPKTVLSKNLLSEITGRIFFAPSSQAMRHTPVGYAWNE